MPEGGAPRLETVAGAVGVALALLAVYAALVFEIEGQQRRTGFPTLRHGSGESAMTGDLAEQVVRAHNEAGVRTQH